MKYLSTTFSFATADETLRQASADLLAALLGDCGYESFEQSRGNLVAFIQARLYDEHAIEAVVSGFPVPSVAISYATAEVEDVDWNSQWEEAGFNPVPVGQTFVIYDARHTSRDAVDAGEGSPIPLLIDTSQTFGSGTHQTTQMMLKSLVEAHPAGQSVLDCGCGTGILGIAAAKLGAKRVLCYDIDPRCADCSRRNADANGVTQVEIRCGDAACLGSCKGGFRLIMANINRNIIVEEMPKILEKADSRGTKVLLSGFLDTDVEFIQRFMSGLGFIQIMSLGDGDWACLGFEGKVMARQ